MEKHVDIEEKALDIIQSDELTQQQLDELNTSAELRDCVQDALDMRTAMHRKHEDVDVEEELKRFKASPHPYFKEEGMVPPRKNSSIKYFSIGLLVAAVFVGAIVLVQTLFPKVDNHKEYFFNATTQTGISLATENGDEATLSPNSKQNTSISLDDFRKIFSDEGNIKEVTLTIPLGKSADIALPDSSKVYLSPGSKLTFPTTFTDDKRVVKLEGMGYFKVRHDAARPFIVLTDKTETTVLGTEFTVNSASGDVSLVSGAVKVKGIASSKTVTIKPEQMVHFANNGKAEITDIDTTPLKAWRDGYLYFDNVELKDIMLAIGANFNKNIDFRSHKAEHYRMHFITERNQGVQAAIEMMNKMEKVKVRLQGNTIIVEDF